MAREITLLQGWQDLTVSQYQEAYRIMHDKAIDSIERAYQLVLLLYKLTERELDETEVSSYRQLVKSLDFIGNEKIEARVKRVIRVNNKKYVVELNPNKLPNSSALSIQKYMPQTEKDIIEFMPYLLARMVCPMKRNLLGVWKKQKHEQRDFDIYVEDMKDVKLLDVYGVFDYARKVMYNIALNVSKNNKDLFIKNAEAWGLTPEEIETGLEALKQLSKIN